MDALVPAFVAALIAGIADRPARIAAILADRYRRPLAVLAGAAIAQMAVAAIAAIAGAAIGPTISPNAQALMLALALAAAGIGAAWPPKPVARHAGSRVGALPTATIATASLAFGGSVAFLTFALAARSPLPALAAAGAVAGSCTLAAAAAILGERGWDALPLRALGLAGAAVLLAGAVVIGAGALRVI